MGSKNIEFAVKALIINENTKVLLVHRPIYPFNVFELPGGRMEFGETAEETLLREVMEETNLKVKPIKILDTWNYINPDYQITGIIYLCKCKDSLVKISSEHDSYAWFDLDENLKNHLHSIFKIRMENWNIEEIKN